MRDFIKQRLREELVWGEEPSVSSQLAIELDRLESKNGSLDDVVKELRRIEDKYAEEYAEYLGDSYGVIDAIKRVIPSRLAKLYNQLHPQIRTEQVENTNKSLLRFNNDGRFNKYGSNTIYLDGNPIVDFGVGGIDDIKINGLNIPNALYLKGGYNASEQRKGYGTMGLKFIFDKLPKIMNIIVQCYDTACPFWKKMGGEEVNAKEMPGGHLLRTLKISRDSFE